MFFSPSHFKPTRILILKWLLQVSHPKMLLNYDLSNTVYTGCNTPYIFILLRFKNLLSLY